MKTVRLILFSLFISIASSQEKKASIQKEIDEQLWYPFIEAYNSFDGERYKSLHTKDILRVNKWGIRYGSDFLNGIEERFKKSKDRGDYRKISFVFENRYSKNEIAYEIGYYKVESKRADKESTHYGLFHVVLKKINGKWKLAQDWDTDKLNGIAISEKNFQGKVYE